MIKKSYQGVFLSLISISFCCQITETIAKSASRFIDEDNRSATEDPSTSWDDQDSMEQVLDAGPPTSTAIPASPSPHNDVSVTAASADVTNTPADDTVDSFVLEILGDDPTAIIEYGPDIHKELATRFEHITTNGLESAQRKELLAKYKIPSNCTHIGAPVLNAEIKAALPEAMLKRDKSIESRQKNLAIAISCLASVMTEQFASTQTNQDMLKKLMDTARLLCDIQHTDSKTRRNFAMFSVKKDMKEHLSNTKIDKHLFGENLSEALKSAKAVSKSGIDLKIQNKNPKKSAATPQNSKTQAAKNWKPQAPARRQLGPQRSREPASRRGQPATSSRRSSPPPRMTHRR